VSLLVESRDISKRFYLRHNPAAELKLKVLGLFDGSRRQRVEEFWALKSVSLKVHDGEALGLVGRNGSGKSTFLKVIAGIHRPTSGELLVARGTRIGSMIELGTGFHPELTGQENVLLNTSIHGLSRAEALDVYDDVVAYSGLRHFMDVPLKNYSSGMTMRLGFAIAATMDPDVLLLDEIFAVGDADFQRQCIATLKSFQARGKTIVFVSHASAAVQAVCHRVAILDHGRLLYDGGVDAGLTEYRRLTVSSPHEVLGPEPSEGPILTPSRLAQSSADDPDLAWHRLATGGRWTEEGAWVFDFLRRQGLRPDHYMLDVGCGSLSAASRLLRYMEPSHYWGFEKNIELFIAGSQIELPRAGVRVELGHFIVNDDFDFSESPHAFDLAIASSLFRRLPLNSIARAIAGVVRALAPGGRFYATWPDSPSAASFEPILGSHGVTTYSDREPFHYSFAMLAALAEVVGARAERVDDGTHPRGEAVMVMTRAAKESLKSDV
jgi:ABC-type polysaccharide/polyol phosphate transport system ATPase subunit/SAM-dependent methyltransferase